MSMLKVMDFTYVIILAAILIISPFVLNLASKQNQKTKQRLKFVFLSILIAEIILGFWGGFKVWLFFAVSAIQILLILRCKFTLAVVLNFINTLVFFIGMIRVGQITGIQDSSLTNITVAFLLLIGNVVGLIFINKDKDLLKKYFK